MTAQDWIDTINRIIRNLCVLAMVALVATCARAEQPYTVAQCLAEGEIIANAALGCDQQGDKVTPWFKADMQRLVWEMYYDYREASPVQIRRSYIVTCQRNRELG